MDSQYARITVLIIAYKQENVIGRALDSILCQKEFGLKEIIICDDCSPDGTWDVIMKYKANYPDYIRPYRNNPNKGIYGNVAFTYSLVEDTDYINNCSGDDALCDGFFESFQKFIKDNHVDIKGSNVIYGDYKVVDPYGNEHVVPNDAIARYPDVSAVNLKMRQLLSTRSTLISYDCLKSFDKFPLDKGVPMAEEFCDLQPSLHSKKNYYMPVVGSVYYASIGVSTTMVNEKVFKQRIEAWTAVLNTEYIELDEKTKHSVQYNINTFEFLIKKRFTTFFLIWWHYFKSGKSCNPRIIAKILTKMLVNRDTIKKLKRLKNW